MEDTFAVKVYTLCKQVPSGKVTTYKEIALALGTKAYRAVGQALRCNPSAPFVPCHRVVCSSGEVGGFCGKKTSMKKVLLLQKEGVVVQQGKIDLNLFGYIF